jgi:hypothetical protein
MAGTVMLPEHKMKAILLTGCEVFSHVSERLVI